MSIFLKIKLVPINKRHEVVVLSLILPNPLQNKYPGEEMCVNGGYFKETAAMKIKG